jgi:cytochrome c oxidase assembly protein subunit 15
MLVGAYVAGAGYGLACNGWPLCNSQLIPDTSAVSVQVNFLHRILGLLLGIVVLTLAVIGWRLRSRSPLAARLSGAALAVYVAQALIGASNVWTSLGEEAVIAHLAVGTLLWVVLAVLNTRVYHLHELLPASSAGRAHQPDLAGAVR